LGVATEARDRAVRTPLPLLNGGLNRVTGSACRTGLRHERREREHECQHADHTRGHQQCPHVDRPAAANSQATSSCGTADRVDDDKSEQHHEDKKQRRGKRQNHRLARMFSRVGEHQRNLA